MSLRNRHPGAQDFVRFMAKRPSLPEPLRYIEGSDAARTFPGRLSYTLADYLRAATNQDNYVVVYEAEEKVVGVAWIECAKGVITIHHLETDAGFQGGGVGSTLLAGVEKRFAPLYEATRISLSALEDAELLAWYEKRGFKRVGLRRDEPGYGPVVPMRKTL